MNLIEQIKLYRDNRLRERMLPIFDDYFKGITGRPYGEWQKDKRQELQAMENRMWFEGKQEKLEWFYKEYMMNVADQYTLSYKNNVFWKAVDDESVKLHFPLASAISEAMSNLLFHGTPEISIDTGKIKESEFATSIINETWEENNKDNLLQRGAQLESYSGTIAARVIVDTNFSDYPIIKFHPSSEFELIEEYGRVTEIVFNDIYKYSNKKFILKSHYGKGYIRYQLLNERNKEIPLNSIPETSQLKDLFLVDKDGEPIKLMLAVYKVNRPCENEFIDSNYGESDYSSLIDIFQAIDETYSAIIDRIRKGHIVTFLSEDLAEKDDNGNIKKRKKFNIETVILNGNPDPSLRSTLDRSVPNLDIEKLYEPLKQMLRDALSRVGLSPNTVIENLGGANSSAEALEIREGVSARTREAKIRLWEKFLNDISRLVLIFSSLSTAKTYLESETGTAYIVEDDGGEYEYKCVFPPYKPETWKDRLPSVSAALEAGLIDKENALQKLWKDEYTEDELQAMKDNIDGIINIDDTEETDNGWKNWNRK